MEIKEILLENMNCIVKQIYNREENISDMKYLESIYSLIENDIEMNIDSDKLYFLSYSLMDRHEIYFRYFKDLNTKILTLIESLIIGDNRMLENIKNKHHRIHFRLFKDNVNLESPDNKIRIEFFFQSIRFLKDNESIFNFLINKLLTLENKVKKQTEIKINDLVVIKRLKIIISSLVKRIVL